MGETELVLVLLSLFNLMMVKQYKYCVIQCVAIHCCITHFNDASIILSKMFSILFWKIGPASARHAGLGATTLSLALSHRHQCLCDQAAVCVHQRTVTRNGYVDTTIKLARHSGDTAWGQAWVDYYIDPLHNSQYTISVWGLLRLVQQVLYNLAWCQTVYQFGTLHLVKDIKRMNNCSVMPRLTIYNSFKDRLHGQNCNCFHCILSLSSNLSNYVRLHLQLHMSVVCRAKQNLGSLALNLTVSFLSSLGSLSDV